jgi:hypothetical protein
MYKREIPCGRRKGAASLRSGLAREALPERSTRNVYCRKVLSLFLIGAAPLTVGARGKSSPTYDGAIDFGSQLIRLQDGCLDVQGRVTSGDFFEDLKRTDSGGQFEFKKRGKLVTEYPESLSTSIRIAGECAAALSNPPSSVFQGDSYSLRLQVDWKEGMELRPAALSPVVARCVGSSSTPIPSRGSSIPVVTCQMTVDARGVPLVDHLIVSVFGSNGKLLTRLSAAP